MCSDQDFTVQHGFWTEHSVVERSGSLRLRGNARRLEEFLFFFCDLDAVCVCVCVCVCVLIARISEEPLVCKMIRRQIEQVW